MGIFFFKAVGGLMDWSNKAELFQFLMDNDGKNMFANINKVKGVRSLSQNNLYWVYLETIANETGNSAEDLHRLFKGLFLPKRTVVFKGKEYTMSGSTTELSKGDFTLYLDKICGETGVPIPDLEKASIAYPVSDESNKPIF